MGFANPLTSPIIAQAPALDLAQGIVGPVSTPGGVGVKTIGTLTLTPPAGKTAMLVGWDWSLHLTAVTSSPAYNPLTITITGLAGGALTYLFPKIVAVGDSALGSQSYSQPVPASGVGVPIVITFTGQASNGVTTDLGLNGYAYSQ